MPSCASERVFVYVFRSHVMALAWPRSYAEQTNRPVIALIDVIEEGHATLNSGTQHERYHLIDNLKQKKNKTTQQQLGLT